MGEMDRRLAGGGFGPTAEARPDGRNSRSISRLGSWGRGSPRELAGIRRSLPSRRRRCVSSVCVCVCVCVLGRVCACVCVLACLPVLRLELHPSSTPRQDQPHQGSHGVPSHVAWRSECANQDHPHQNQPTAGRRIIGSADSGVAHSPARSIITWRTRHQHPTTCGVTQSVCASLTHMGERERERDSEREARELLSCISTAWRRQSCDAYRAPRDTMCREGGACP